MMTALFILADGRKQLRQLHADMQEVLEPIASPMRFRMVSDDDPPEPMSYRTRRYRRVGRSFNGVPIFIDTDHWADVKECRWSQMATKVALRRGSKDVLRYDGLKALDYFVKQDCPKGSEVLDTEFIVRTDRDVLIPVDMAEVIVRQLVLIPS